MAGWKENKLLIPIAVILLIISIIGIIMGLQPKKAKMVLMSRSSGEVMEAAVLQGAKMPLKNPKTGQEDLYPAIKVKCGKCGAEFYGIQSPEVMSKTTCPKCGATPKDFIVAK